MASVVWHPESEPQKNIALDTEKDLPPHTPISYRGSPGSGMRPSDTAGNDPNTGTGDVTEEERTGPTQDATRTSSKDGIGGDVAMREDSADEKQCRTLEFFGVRQQEKDHNEEGTT